MSRAGLGHHFGSRDELGVGMAGWLVEQVTGFPVDEIDRWLHETPSDDVLAWMHGAAQANWDAFSVPEEIRYESRLLSVLAAAVEDRPDTADLRRLVKERFRGRYLPALEGVYQVALDRSGRRLIEPFTLDEVARLLDGLAESLLIQRAFEPGAVRDDLFADAVSVIVTAITTPVSEVASVDDLSAYFVRRAASVPPVDLASWLEFLGLVAPLFAGGIGPVTFSALSRAGHRSAGEIRETFGTVRNAAASTFARHLDTFELAANRNPSAPGRALSDLLCEIARVAAAEPHVAQALMSERLLARTTVGPDVGPGDIRLLVPLGPMVSLAMRPVAGIAVQPLVDLATSVINTLLAYASTHVSVPPHLAAEHAMRLIPSAIPRSVANSGENAEV